MTISVALATYNGASFLAQQLASIAGQTRLPAELVISDDGSTDETLAVVERFAQTAPFAVRVLTRPERLGFADNFLVAAEACRHPLIAFCDQDDVWLPDKLRVAMDRMAIDDSLLSLHTLTVTDAALCPTGFHWKQGINRDTVFEPLQIDPFGTGWGNTMLFRSTLLGLIPRAQRPRNPGVDRPLSHDAWIYELAAALGRVSHIATPLILYRQHGENTSGSTRQRRRSKLLAMARVPIIEYRARAKFEARMAALFAELAEKPGDFAAPARKAAEHVAKRQAYWASRVDVFDSTTFAKRLAAFHETRALTADSPLWIGSRIKDLVLGVAGLGSTPIGAPLLSEPLPF